MIPRTTRADEAELASRLRLAITRTARRMRQEAGGGLSPSLAAALATVERHGPLAPSRLAEIEAVKRPTATRILARLGEAGLVERTPDPSDGRAVLVAVTSEGKRVLRELRSRKTAYLASRLAALPAGDRDALDRAAAVLERLLDEDRA